MQFCGTLNLLMQINMLNLGKCNDAFITAVPYNGLNAKSSMAPGMSYWVTGGTQRTGFLVAIEIINIVQVTVNFPAAPPKTVCGATTTSFYIARGLYQASVNPACSLAASLNGGLVFPLKCARTRAWNHSSTVLYCLASTIQLGPACLSPPSPSALQPAPVQRTAK